MQPNPNPNDLARMQSQTHQGFPYNAQAYTLPITGAPQQTAQQALLQQTQMNQRRQRNMKKVPANPQPLPPRNVMPQPPTFTFQQYLSNKCPQDPEHLFMFKIFSPNFSLPINDKIIQLLNPFIEDPRYFNFIKHMQIPTIFERILDLEPKVYFPSSNLIQTNQILPNQNVYEFKLDMLKPNINIDKIFLVCYYIKILNLPNNILQMTKLPNTKLNVIKQGNINEGVDCYQYGELEQYYFYVCNTTRDQYPLYIKPVSDNLLFFAIPCKLKSEEAIKKAILSKKSNIPPDISLLMVCCPCRQQTYNLDTVIKTISTKGDMICTACKKTIVLDKLEIANSDSTELINIILYYHFQSKIMNNTDPNLIDEFINVERNDENDENENQLPDFQNTQEYIDAFNTLFS